MAKSSLLRDQSTARLFDCLTYLSRDQLVNLLQQSPYVKSYAAIVHDRDVWRDDDDLPDGVSVGDQKQEHIHFVLCSSMPLHLSTVRHIFDGLVDDDGLKVNTRVVIPSDKVRSVRYLVHADDLDKFQYDWDSDVFGINPAYFRKLFFNDKQVEKVEDVLWEATNDLLQGASLRDLLDKYGGRFVTNYYKIKQLVKDIHIEDYDRNCDHYKTSPHEGVHRISSDSPYVDLLVDESTGETSEKVNTLYEIKYMSNYRY